MTDDYLNESEDEVGESDPFAGLTTKEQDTFFRILDVLSEEFGDQAFEFYMSNPTRIRQLLETIKQQKIMVKKLNQEGWNALLENEVATLRNLADAAATVPSGSEAAAEDPTGKEAF